MSGCDKQLILIIFCVERNTLPIPGLSRIFKDRDNPGLDTQGEVNFPDTPGVVYFPDTPKAEH